MKSKICLVLTEETIEKNLKLFEKYRKYIDLLELRVDFLSSDEIFHVYKFPSLVDVPVILTIRRKIDGGEFAQGEYTRALSFARAINADATGGKNFEYIDLENDVSIPSIEDACEILGIKIIRSFHSINAPVSDIPTVFNELKKKKHEIIKIASKSFSLKDTIELFKASKTIKDSKSILVSMGKYGIISRILSSFLSSEIVYTFSDEAIERLNLKDEMLSPATLFSTYNFDKINEKTEFYGIIGENVNSSLSPSLHNSNFSRFAINALYLPFSAKDIDDAFLIAKYLKVKALSVTSPFKILSLQYANEVHESAKIVKATNTLSFFNNVVTSYNTDIVGFEKALKEFLEPSSKPLKASLLGAGGASRAVCYALKKMGFSDVIVFDRVKEKAELVASPYAFKAALLDISNLELLQKYSSLIINATTVGMGSLSGFNPISFYKFLGHEYVFDLIYNPPITLFLKKAKEAGCKTCNGYSMLKYQAKAQFNIFNGRGYDW